MLNFWLMILEYHVTVDLLSMILLYVAISSIILLTDNRDTCIILLVPLQKLLLQIQAM